jgi:hypothetical protein
MSEISRVPSLDKELGNSTKQLKQFLDAWFESDSWIGGQTVDNKFPRTEYPFSNYVLDWQKISYCERHGKALALNFEYCFDNRQSIGTNLLKMETINRRLEKENAHESYGVLLTATSKAINANGWNGAAACTDEYENAILHGYEQILTSKICVLSLKA